MTAATVSLPVGDRLFPRNLSPVSPRRPKTLPPDVMWEIPRDPDPETFDEIVRHTIRYGRVRS